MAGKLFGTDGIRGKANQWPITPEVGMRIGRAIARVLNAQCPGKHKVVIGKDTRLSGYMLENAITAGLVSEGARVLLTGPLPTPAIAYITKSMACDAGVMLTASHNPYMDNGIKIFGPDGYKLNDALEAEVEAIILEENLAEPQGQLGKAFRIDDATGRYIEFAKAAIHARSLKGLKVVVDCANGAGYYVGPLILQELGAEVIKMATKPDGVNINEGVGALYPEKAGALVLEHGADVGICLDGDADRVIFIDEKGDVLSGDKVLFMCAKALKQRGQLANDTLVATVMSNLGLKTALAAEGIELAATGVGDRLVIECMREHGHSLGGENSGHIIFADSATTGDGLMSGLKVLEIMLDSGMTLSELAQGMEEFPQELHAIEVASKPAIDSVPGLVAVIDEIESTLGDSGRVLVRYSGTENKIRVLVEAQCADAARDSAESICSVVRNTIGA
ncbi:phosphoglucosamine mutase [Rubritalea marina]|uniref:phosphoglucosamine mutase n=1 Tax=Rubritalea marina TaxID=361055 RepID=UPI00047619A1|nr:phosphoglucosamine mutase [Rubritalea marina]